MNQDIFGRLLDELDGNSVETLKAKNAKYAKGSEDCLHNFKEGAEVNGRTTAQTCWGYMSKHLVALRDMVNRNDFSDREDFLEKCQDTINYIRFLWCIGNEENEKLTSGLKTDISDPSVRTVIVETKEGYEKERFVYPADRDPCIHRDVDFFMIFFTNPIGRREWHLYHYDKHYYYYEPERKDNHEK